MNPEPELHYYQQRYLNLVTPDLTLARSLDIWLQAVEGVDLNFRYAADKWTLAQLWQHVIDTELIFTYRALCFARGEEEPLPGFDENRYAESGSTELLNADYLRELHIRQRHFTQFFFAGLSETAKNRTGTASGRRISPAILHQLIIGHELHHAQIVRERYRLV